MSLWKIGAVLALSLGSGLVNFALADDDPCDNNCISLQQLVDADEGGSYPKNFTVQSSWVGITGLSALTNSKTQDYIQGHIQEALYKFWATYLKDKSTPIGFKIIVNPEDSEKDAQILDDDNAIYNFRAGLQNIAQQTLQASHNTHSLGQLTLDLQDSTIESDPAHYQNAVKSWQGFYNNIYSSVHFVDNQINPPILECTSSHVSQATCSAIQHTLIQATHTPRKTHEDADKSISHKDSTHKHHSHKHILHKHILHKHSPHDHISHQITITHEAEIPTVIHNAIENAKTKKETSQIDFTSKAAGIAAMKILGEHSPLSIEAIASASLAQETPHNPLKDALAAGTLIRSEPDKIDYGVHLRKDNSADLIIYRFHKEGTDRLMQTEHFNNSDEATIAITQKIARVKDKKVLFIAPKSEPASGYE